MATITNGRLIHARVIQQPQSTGHNLGVQRAFTAIDRITVHHTASSAQNPTIANVNNWWASNGWDRAGYHFLIRGDGVIWQLIPLHAPSWGAGAVANPRSIHISFAGTFTSTVSPTQAARDSFGFLCNLILGSNQLPNLSTTNQIVGHREWSATACPGFTRAQYRAWAGTPTTTSPPATGGTHTVRAGETLFSISQMYGTTVVVLQQLNNMGTSTVIHVGQVLRLPGVRIHTVRAGDTLSNISQLYVTTVAAIQQVNSMGSSTVIHVGHLLRIP